VGAAAAASQRRTRDAGNVGHHVHRPGQLETTHTHFNDLARSVGAQAGKVRYYLNVSLFKVLHICFYVNQ
jgi:hypothetical protein